MKDPMTVVSRFSLFTLAASVLLAPLGLVLGSADSTQAAVVEGGKGPHSSSSAAMMTTRRTC